MNKHKSRTEVAPGDEFSMGVGFPMQKFLHLDFIPRSADFALLLLRLWLGLSMLILHGWDKLVNFPKAMGSFPDPLHISSPVSLTLAVFAEFACSILLVLGLLTRLAAFSLVVTMVIACFLINGGQLRGGGELAFIYLGGYLTLLFAGAGKFSVDRR